MEQNLDDWIEFEEVEHNSEDWRGFQEEVSSLKWCMRCLMCVCIHVDQCVCVHYVTLICVCVLRSKNGPERYVSSWEGHMAVRLRFQLQLRSEYKKRCGLVQEARCVLSRCGRRTFS